MHQTFYIDIDEEITSIIERLKKAKAKEIIVVVPKRALLIQSIINLKLLKKEADKLKKEIIIVTQDKLGKLLVEKAGIIAEQRLDEVEAEDSQISDEEAEVEEDVSPVGKFSTQKNDLEELGSESYFESLAKEKRRPSAKIEVSEEASVEKILNKELVSDITKGAKKGFFSKNNIQSLDMVKNIDIKQNGPEEEATPLPVKKRRLDRSEKNTSVVGRFFTTKNNEIEEKIASENKIDEFFTQPEKLKKKEKSAPLEKKENCYSDVQVTGKVWKGFLWFCFAILFIGTLVGTYLYLPQVLIILEPKVAVKSMDFEINGLSDIVEINSNEDKIPVKMIDVEKEITKSFSATGSTSDSSKKARGMITIYNEFSSSSQPLIATTRFLNEDGKLFRLQKSIIVPGSSNVGGEIKPGVIEAQVMADEAGADFNIEASKFSIPGFKSSGGKYEKIYAQSSKKMIGGGDSATEIKAVSEEDITEAKSQMASEIKESLKKEIKEQNGNSLIVLDDAIIFGEINYSSSAQAGAIGEDFSLTGKVSAKAIVFQEDHLKKLVTEKIVSTNGISKEQLGEDTFKFEFGKADADFENKKIIIRMSLKARILPDLDLDKMKEDILGKSEEEFADFIGQFKDLDSANIVYKKSFFSGRIPAFSSRVELTLDNN